MTDSTLANNPPTLGFLDSFLQERNIKWLLAIGALILLGSSLMLITSHWGSYTPLWKYSIMLAYTAAIYVIGIGSYHRFGLRKTGTSLLALTVLLIPALFLGLAWVHGQTDALGGRLLFQLIILGLTTVFAALVSKHIFQHFLASPQPTFQLSYLGLCLAATLAPLVPAAFIPGAILALWLLFAVGTIKVNRHIFWLTEQQQSPQIFAFFPIALLGSLFIAILGFHFNAYITQQWEWLGLACVMAAIPVLQTADVAAQVFGQRTGGLVERRPAPVIIPLLVGLILSLTGLVLSFAGLLPGHSPLTITPTALLVALVAQRVAQRTSKQSFVWAMLVCITIGYNFSPFYFQQIAQSLIASSANAIQESALPLAFYGLSYLPLLIAFTVIAVISQRKGLLFYSRPLHYFSIGLAALLLVFATSHAKALFPVAACLLGLFVTQTVLLRQRWIAIFALLAGALVACGWPVFSATVLDINPWWNKSEFGLALYAFLLLIPGYKVDAFLQRLPATQNWQRFIQGQWLSLVIAFTLILLHWSIPASANERLVAALVLVTLLLILCTRLKLTWLIIFTFCFAYISAIDSLIAYRFSIANIISSVTLALLLQWGVGYLFKAIPGARISQIFATANYYFCHYGLLILFCGVYLSLAIADIWQILLLKLIAPWAFCQIAITLIIFDLARHKNSVILTWLACLGIIAISGSLWVNTLSDAADA